VIQPQQIAPERAEQTMPWPVEPGEVGQASVVVGTGDTRNGAPFGAPTRSHNGYQGEYQQVYAATALSELGSGPVTITSVAFKPTLAASSRLAFTYTLAYTKATPTTLNTDYAANVEAPYQTYTGEGVFKARNDGSFQFVLPTSFLYDPSRGNLLLDIYIKDNSGDMIPFAAGESVDTNRVFNYGGSGTPTIGHSNGTLSYGLLTKFTAVPADSAAATDQASILSK
jgi:hypothetical protein